MASTTVEIVWLRWLLFDIGVSISILNPMYCDIMSVIQIAHISVFHERAKQVEIDYFLTRHHFQHHPITFLFVSSASHIAYLFIKTHFI